MLPTSHISQYHNNPRDQIVWMHLVEWSLSLHHAPTFGIYVNQAILNKYIWFITLWMIYWWTYLPFSSIHKLQLVCSCCIYQKNQIPLFGFPTLKCFSSFMFHAKKFQLHYVWCHCNDLCFHTWPNLCQSSNQSPSNVLLCLKSYFTLIYGQKSKSNISLMYSS